MTDAPQDPSTAHQPSYSSPKHSETGQSEAQNSALPAYELIAQAEREAWESERPGARPQVSPQSEHPTTILEFRQ